MAAACKTCRRQTDLETDYRSGHVVCSECGTICAPIIEERSEWRTFPSDNAPAKDQSRAGGAENPFLSGDLQLTTTALKTAPKPGKIWADTNTATITSRTTISGADKKLINAQREIQFLCGKIGLPQSTVNKALGIFKSVHQDKLLAGCSNASIVAGCIHTSCRYTSIHMTFKEISTECNVKKKSMSKACKLIQSIVDNSNAIRTARGLTSTQSALSYIERYCSKLRIPDHIRIASERTLVFAQENAFFGGRSPLSAVAASMFFACNLYHFPRTVKDLESVVDITETTIKLAYKDLENKREELILEVTRWIQAKEIPDPATFAYTPATSPPAATDGNTPTSAS